MLVTLAVTGQRRFGAGHMNQMFDRMQRAQQDSYGKNRFYCDHGSNDSLIGVNSFQNKFSAWPFPRHHDVWISVEANKKCSIKFSELAEMIIS